MVPAGEVPLDGGNMTGGVVRVGDTVRRPAGPWTPAVHALLDHLHAVGFAGAPRALGIDEKGREVLSYVPGVIVPVHPDDRLGRVARLIRDFHDAVAGFTPPPGARWQALIPPDGAEIIAHHDLAPWNLVVGDGGCTFIDWDVAAPGTRLGDLAYAVHGFVPLAADPVHRRADAGHRLRLIADAYGLDEAERRRIVPLLADRTRAMHTFLAEQARRGAQPWTRLWQEGHGAVWRSDADYIAERADVWLRALLG